MKICDMHTHSDNSFDAKDSVDKICQSAIKKGLLAVAITDHCEAPMIRCGADCECGCLDEKIPKSVRDTLNAKQKYSKNIKVLCGMELGEPMHDDECTKKALNYGDFDFILASVHNLRGMEDFYYLNYDNLDVDEILKLYFDELAETASFKNYDSLAHMTYPLRYIFEKTGSYPDLSKFKNQTDDILNILVKNKKALEINVSGLFKGLGVTLPDETLIRRFRELGGEFITIGTDAHSEDYVGKGIENGIKTAEKCGFAQYTIYENHEPIMIDFK